jgi:hypothetical protein
MIGIDLAADGIAHGLDPFKCHRLPASTNPNRTNAA